MDTLSKDAEGSNGNGNILLLFRGGEVPSTDPLQLVDVMFMNDLHRGKERGAPAKTFIMPDI